jgi:hypothetical protein
MYGAGASQAAYTQRLPRRRSQSPPRQRMPSVRLAPCWQQACAPPATSAASSARHAAVCLRGAGFSSPAGLHTAPCADGGLLSRRDRAPLSARCEIHTPAAYCTPAQRARSMKFSPPMTLLTKRMATVVPYAIWARGGGAKGGEVKRRAHREISGRGIKTLLTPPPLRHLKPKLPAAAVPHPRRLVPGGCFRQNTTPTLSRPRPWRPPASQP